MYTLGIVIKCTKFLKCTKCIQVSIKQQIRITDSFSFDYADSPYHLITSSPQSCGLSAITFSALLKSPQKFISYSFLPENQCTILIYAAWRKWRLWRKLHRHSATSAIPATCTFLTQKKVFFLFKYLRICIFCCTFAPAMVVYVPPNKVFFTH